MNKIREVIEGIYDNEIARKTVTPLFLGNTGLGKTQIIEKFAKDRKVKINKFVTSQRNPFEISGMAIPDKDLKKMSIWDFDTLLGMNDGDILFFDEILNGNPVVLNACLTLLEDRETISGRKLPNIMIIAAANPQGMAPLTPQIKERFMWYKVKFVENFWSNYMNKKYKTLGKITRKLSHLINTEDFSGYNFFTPRSIDKSVNMAINNILMPEKYNVEVLPILNTFVENESGKEIILSDNKVLAPNEKIEWLKLIKYKNKIIK